jgi:hypothetical protein
MTRDACDAEPAAAVAPDPVPLAQVRRHADSFSGQSDFWVILLRARALCTVLLPAALIPFTSFGPGRHVIAVIAGLVGTAANLTMLRRLRAGRSLRAHLAVTDIATVLTAMVFLPAG